MRYDPGSSARAKSVAKSLRASLAVEGIERTHSDCLATVSRLYGFRCWRDLQANADRHPRSLGDADAGAEVASARRLHHLSVMKDEGLSDEAAARIVDALAPTAGRVPARAVKLEASDDPLVISMRSAAGIRELLSTAASHVVTKFSEMLIFETTWNGLLWHVLVAGGHGLAVSDDGRHVMASDLVGGRDHGDCFRSMVDSRDEGGSHDDLSRVLARFGYGKPFSGDEPSDDPRLAEVRQVLMRLDAGVLSTLRTVKRFSIATYVYLAALPTGPGTLRGLLDDVPLLGALIAYDDKFHGGGARPLGNGIGRGGDPVVNAAEILAEDRCKTTEMRRVLEALRGVDHRYGDDFYGFSLQVLARLPSSALPRSAGDFRAMMAATAAFDSLEHRGMPFDNIYRELSGSDWIGFEKIRAAVGANSVTHISSDLPDELAIAFAEAYGIRLDVVVDEPFSQAVSLRLMPRLLKAHSALEICKAASEWYASCGDGQRGECGIRLAQDLLPSDLRDLDALGVLEGLGYEPGVLAAQLLEDPDLEFDEEGLPVMSGGGTPSSAAPRMAIDKREERGVGPLAGFMLPLPSNLKMPSGWRRIGNALVWGTSGTAYRIRLSDGSREAAGSGPGWYLDRGWVRKDPDNGLEVSSFPQRMGRFGTLDDATASIAQEVHS